MRRSGSSITQTLTIIFLILAGTSGACKTKPTPTPTQTPTSTVVATVVASPTVTSTPTPKPSMTPEPPGSPNNPVVIGFINLPDQPESGKSAGELANQLAIQTGNSIQRQPYDTYQALLAGMKDGKVHLAALPPFTYIQAHKKGLADAVLITNHFGVYSYGTQYLAHVGSGFTVYFDQKSETNTADAATGLRQFANRRPCWTEPRSAAGDILPLGLLNQYNIPLEDAVITQSFNATLRALYVNGICDFGATYAISGDPRTASTIHQDFPDIMEKVVVIWRSEAYIPNLNFSIAPSLPENIKQALVNGMLEISKTDPGRLLMTSMTGYNIDGLKKIDDTFYEPLRIYTEWAGGNLADLVGR